MRPFITMRKTKITLTFSHIKSNIDIDIRHNKIKDEFFNLDNRQRAYRECWTAEFISRRLRYERCKRRKYGKYVPKKYYLTFKILEKGYELDESETDTALDDGILLDEEKMDITG